MIICCVYRDAIQASVVFLCLPVSQYSNLAFYVCTLFDVLCNISFNNIIFKCSYLYMQLLAVFLITNYQCLDKNRSKLVHDVQWPPQLPETIISGVQFSKLQRANHSKSQNPLWFLGRQLNSWPNASYSQWTPSLLTITYARFLIRRST